MAIKIPLISVKAEYNKEKNLGSINMLSVGYGMHEAWIYAAMFSPYAIFNAPVGILPFEIQLSSVWLLSIIVYSICLITIGTIEHKIIRALLSKKLIVAAALVVSISTAFIMGTAVGGTFGLVSTIIGGVGTGVGSALLKLFWGASFSREDSPTIAVNSALAVVIGIAIYSVVLHQIPFPYSGCIASLLPLFEGIILWKRRSVTLPTNDENLPFNFLHIKKGSFALKFLPPVIIFGVALGLLRQTSVQEILPAATAMDQILMLGAAAIATLIILVTVLVIKKPDQWSFLFRPIIPFIAFAVFFLPFAGSGNFTFSSLIILVAYMCFEALIWISLGELSQKYRIPPFFLFGIGCGSMAVGSTLGSSFALDTLLMTFIPANEYGISIICLVAMLIAFALLPRESAIQKTVLNDTSPSIMQTPASNNKVASQRPSIQETSEREDPSQNPHSSIIKDGQLRNRCEKVAHLYMLSRRETEVLHYLARGHTSSYIQEKLVISEGTAKTHIHHIYKKLDIHSQRDLILLIDEQSFAE